MSREHVSGLAMLSIECFFMVRGASTTEARVQLDLNTATPEISGSIFNRLTGWNAGAGADFALTKNGGEIK